MKITDKNLKENTTYWFSMAFFKHAANQLSKSHRLVKPTKVTVERRGSGSSEVFIKKEGTNVQMYHPSFYSFQIRDENLGNYVGNFVFETEEEAWKNYYAQVQKELERMEEVYQKRKSVISSFLVK